MQKKNRDNLFRIKEKIVDNCDTLLAKLEECTDGGMKDYSAHLYNQIIALQEDVGPLDTLDDLEMIIVRATTIEKEIDRWQATQGESTLGLEWPHISKPPVIE